MTAYVIPPELRPWVEVTAPTLDGDGWSEARRIAGCDWAAFSPFQRDMQPFTQDQARALLAYVAEIADGLSGIVFDAVTWAAMGERAKARDARLWATPDADKFVTEGGDLEPLGREVARVLNPSQEGQ